MYIPEYFNQPDRWIIGIFRLLSVLVLCVAIVPVSGAQDPVWWEAEAFADSSGVSRESHPVLSGEEWIHVQPVEAGQARFLSFDDVPVAEPGRYQFYVRKFWRHGPFSWQFENSDADGDDAGASGEVTRDVPLIDSASMRLHTGANWVWAGEVELAAGDHALRLELTEPEGAAAFDAFVLTREPFPFRGQYRPDDHMTASVPGWFPWHAGLPAADGENGEDGESPLDLRYLNEDQAGDNGFIQARGEDFVHGDTGETVRFWGVSAGFDVGTMDAFSARRYARDMARYGVNLVRLHFALYDGEGADFHQLNRGRIDRLRHFIAILKSEGIYSSVSIFFPLWISLGPDDPRFPGYEGSRPFGSIFFDENLQAVYRYWWRTLLMAPDPDTGLPLKDDPAVFSLELVNEDSLLFPTFNDRNLPDQARADVETRFGAWLRRQHGGFGQTVLHWRGNLRLKDELWNGRFSLLPLYDISQGKTRRARDTARFLTELQRDFFRRHQDFLKQELGFGGMVSASNWKTADERVLGPLDKYSNTVGDFMDRHAYFNPVHEDEGDGSAAFSLRVGHRFENRSSLVLMTASDQSIEHPVLDITYDGKPSILSEVNWTPPNRYRADMPFMLATWGRLQGMDAIINFASSPTPWDMQLGKFSTHSPVIKGQWPAAALAFRRGDVTEGETVARAVLPLEEHLYELQGSPLSLRPNYDTLRRPEETGDVDLEGTVHPLTLLTGKARVDFIESGEARLTVRRDLPIDTANGSVRSVGDQMQWHYRDGYSMVDTPRLQGMTGFLSRAGTVQLGDVAIQSDMDYGSLWLMSLDGEPLATSATMLLLAMSEDRMHGFRSEQTGELHSIKALGTAPFMVRSITGEVSLLRKDADALVVTPLDQSGRPRGQQWAMGARSELASDVVYYLIKKAVE